MKYYGKQTNHEFVEFGTLDAAEKYFAGIEESNYVIYDDEEYEGYLESITGDISCNYHI